MPMFRDLKVDLTPEEFDGATSQLVEEMAARKALKAEAKDSAASFKTRIDDKDKLIDQLRQKVHDKAETRAVEVYEQPDIRRYVIEIKRADNHKLVDSRAMTANERHIHSQTKLPLVPEDPPKPGSVPVSGDAQEAGKVVPMKTSAGDITVTNGAGGLPESSPALPQESAPVPHAKWCAFLALGDKQGPCDCMPGPNPAAVEDLLGGEDEAPPSFDEDLGVKDEEEGEGVADEVAKTPGEIRRELEKGRKGARGKKATKH